MAEVTPACAKPTWKYPNGRTGTVNGYQAHSRAGEDPCAPCAAALSAKNAARRQQRPPEQIERERKAAAENAKRRRNADPARAAACIANGSTGTVDGFVAHATAGQVPCLPCREASRVPGAYGAVCARPTRLHPNGRTGTRAGYMAHVYAEETPCPACLDGNAANAARERADDPLIALRDNLWSKYRLTLEAYNDLLAEQDGKCAICGSPDPGDVRAGRFHVDHDHACCPGSKSCGQCVRGLLCRGCNTALGNFGDDPDRLLAAAAYLMTTREASQ